MAAIVGRLASGLACAILAFSGAVYAHGRSQASATAPLAAPGSVGDGNFFPFAVWYSGGKARAPLVPAVTSGTDLAAWRADLRQIKALGFNTVRTWVSWSDAEPREGQYDFSHLETLMKLADEAHLRVIIQMYVDSAPEWVGKKFGKDALFETESGLRIIPQAAPGYSIDDPGVRAAIGDFFTHTARIAIRYPNFLGWDIWSEPHIINWIVYPWVKYAQYGFNPYTQERFRKWLRGKYKTLDALNASWGRHFLDWDEVSAPRYSTILTYTDFIDWKQFLYAKMAGDMRFKYDLIRKVDRTHVITAHASPPSILSSPLNGRDASNDFQRARQLDYYGLSMYPYHGNHDGNWTSWELELEPDFSYAANRQHGGFYVGELQAGQGTVGLNVGDPITPADEREWIWTAIAEGAKAINVYAYYPMSTGFESGGYGLVKLDGGLTPRAEEVGRIATAVEKNSSVLVDSRPVAAEVALVYNPLSQMIGGYNNVGTDLPMLHSKSLIGYYRYFAQRDIPVTFIDDHELEDGDLSRYRLIIAPYSLVMTEKSAKAMAKYVEQGGHLVGEARMAWNDAEGDASTTIPGLGLAALFGTEEQEVRKSRRVSFTATDSPSQITKGLRGDTFDGAFFAESMAPLQQGWGHASVLAKFANGGPAMVASTNGKGETLYIGSFLGLALDEFTDKAADEKLLGNILDWADVQRPIASDRNGEDVEVRLQYDAKDRSYLLFVINHTKAAQSATVRLNAAALDLDSDRAIELRELPGTGTRSSSVAANAIVIDAQLPAQGVQVWQLGSATAQ